MTGTKNSGRRGISADDKARFWASINAGLSITESCKIAGIHYNTGQNWVAKNKLVKANLEAAQVEAKIAGVKDNKRSGEAYRRLQSDLAEAAELPPVIPYERLSERAKRGWDDFAYFRRVYLGRVDSPWQVDAGYKIVSYLESEDKEFMVLNCPPGAGKSTLFHDVAVGLS